MQLCSQLTDEHFIVVRKPEDGDASINMADYRIDILVHSKIQENTESRPDIDFAKSRVYDLATPPSSTAKATASLENSRM